MKKITTLIGICIILFSTCATGGQDANSQIVPLDEAIRAAAEYLENTLEPGAVVALLNFSSPSEAFSAYVLDELSDRLVNGRKLVVVDRAQLDLIRQEERFQLSGEVSDATAVSIGQKVGAQVIVSGSLTGIGQVFRVRVRALSVETAVIVASRSGDINSSEDRVRNLLGGRIPVVEIAQPAPRPAPAPTPATTPAPAPATATNNISFADVYINPALYQGVLINWRGMATNVNISESATTFDFLIGYDTHRTLEGIVVVSFNRLISLNPERPFELTGRVQINNRGDILIEGISINQSGR